MTNGIVLEVYIENNYPEAEDSPSVIELAGVNGIPWSHWFSTWLDSLSSLLPPAELYELSLRLTSDREITIYNNQYRQKNQPTDVLAFAALENDLILPPELTESLYLGDIVISLDTANLQAQEQKHSLITEIAWLTSHGLLHLLGWDHPDDLSLQQMLQKQAKLLKLIEITA